MNLDKEKWVHKTCFPSEVSYSSLEVVRNGKGSLEQRNWDLGIHSLSSSESEKSLDHLNPHKIILYSRQITLDAV